MASVNINKGLPRPEDPAASLPEDRWEDLLIVRRHWVRSQLPFDCRLLRQVAEDALLMAPRRGHSSAEDFLREELELDPDLVSRVVGWLVREQPDQAVPLKVADYLSSNCEKAGMHANRMLTLEEAVFATAGDNRHTLNRSSRDNITARSQGDGGTSAGYLAARLKKAERDDLLAEIGPGKRFNSVRSAAIEAGIIKPVPTVRLVNDIGKVADNLRKHLTNEQRIALAEALLQ